MTLESASWIAGIVAAVAAIWSLFYQHAQHHRRPNDRLGPERDLASPRSSATRTSQSPKEDKSERLYSEDQVDAVQKLWESVSNAIDITDIEVRDSLILDAAETAEYALEDVRLAGEIGKMLTSREKRENFFYSLALGAVIKKDFDFARQMMKLIPSRSGKEGILEHIVIAQREIAQSIRRSEA